VGSVGFEPIIQVGSVIVSFKDFGRVGPKGLHADIGPLKRFVITRYVLRSGFVIKCQSHSDHVVDVVKIPLASQ
jgi:hypothetical protein